MVRNVCPECGQPIPAGNINIQEGVALCPACGKVSRLSEVASQPDIDAKELATPPAGCTYRQEPIGDGLVVRASLRSAGGAAATLAISLFWNGIVSIFVLLAISSLYKHFVGPLPKWFPAPNAGSRGHPSNDIPLGETWFLCIFLIPFVAIGLTLFFTFVLYLVGRVEVVVNGNDARVRTGIGPFNWTSRFDASAVKHVVESARSNLRYGQPKPSIEIDADRTVNFGSMLDNRRRTWMAGVLNLTLVTRAHGRRPAMGRSSLSRQS